MGGHVPPEALEMLRRKLAARDGKPGYKRNTQALKGAIALAEWQGQSDG